MNGDFMINVNNIKHSSEEDVLMQIAGELQGVIVTDAEGRYTYVNHRWSMMTGYTLDQVMGKYVRDVVRNSKVDDVLQSKKFVSGDAVLLNARTHEEVPVYCSYTPLFQDGELKGCFVYMIQKSEDTSLAIPSNVVMLLENLNEQLQSMQQMMTQTKDALDTIVGSSPQIAKMKHEIVSAARSASTVLIEGETGSGKELVAHAIHELSPRNQQRMVKVNCAAIPAELLESEFFGYAEGAFTGAKKGGRAGKFESANGSTLFLDEINQMPLFLQPKLLRVLQEREIERVGTNTSIPVDTRIISATNVPLERLVYENKFRQDLYFRLNVVRIRIPPLRERKEDIPLLIEDLMKKLNFYLKLQIPGITQEAVERLMEYDWPGNVRELQNVLERAMNLSWFETLDWKYFSDYFSHQPPADLVPPSPAPISSASRSLLRQKTSDTERETLLAVLMECGGNKVKTAEKLGISRTALYKKLRMYQIL